MITAMQMMLNDLISKREVYENAKMYQCVATLETSIELAEYLLKKEKEQIIDAHFNGMDKLATSLSKFLPIKHTISVIQEIKNGGDIHEDGEEYFNKTYKNQTP